MQNNERGAPHQMPGVNAPSNNSSRGHFGAGVRVEKRPDSHELYTIEVAPSHFEQYLAKAVQGLGAKVKVPGFRPGKVPRDVLERQVGLDALNTEAAELAVNELVAKIVKDYDLQLAAAPEIKTEKFEPGAPFVFTVLAPVVKVTLTQKANEITVKRPAVSIEKADVQKVIEEIRESRVKTAAADRPAALGDLLEINFTTRVAGVKVEHGESENHPVILGQKHFLPGFEEQLVGLKNGEEKDFELTAPKDYYHPALAGKRVQFHVKVRQVFSRALPEVTDEFAKSLGNFKTVADLEKSITEGLKHERGQAALEEARARLLQKISEASKAEYPSRLVDDELKFMLEDLKNRLAQTGLDWATYLGNLKKDEPALVAEWRPRAEERVKISLIIDALIKKQQISVSDEAVGARANAYLQHFKSPKAAAKQVSPRVLFGRVKHELEREALFKNLEKQILPA